MDMKREISVGKRKELKREKIWKDEMKGEEGRKRRERSENKNRGVSEDRKT